MKEIICKTSKLLAEKDEWKMRYKKYLKEIFRNSGKESKGFRKPIGLSIYSTVSDRNERKYYLRFNGQNVGLVFPKREGKLALKILNDSDSKNGIKGLELKKDEIVDWYGEDAAHFRSFFKKLSEDTKTKSPEHTVENWLLKEFRKSNSQSKALCYIQPVLLHGQFFQMPTPIKASTHAPEYEKQFGGGIDILARVVKRNEQHRLCVMEIKDENTNSESQRKAMEQAVAYATFISTLLSEDKEWWEFFSGHKQKTGRSHLNKNNIDVVTIMPSTTEERETFEGEVEVDNTEIKLHCYSLYYDKNEFITNKRFIFSGSYPETLKPRTFLPQYNPYV